MEPVRVGGANGGCRQTFLIHTFVLQILLTGARAAEFQAIELLLEESTLNPAWRTEFTKSLALVVFPLNPV
jgi:hypothetical protein